MKKIASLAVSFVMLSTAWSANAALLSTPLTTGTMYPSPNSTTTVTGTCGSINANTAVSFSILRNGVNTNLPTTSNLLTDSTGTFNGNLTFPQTLPAGLAVLVAQCNNGDTINSDSLIFSEPASTSFNFAGNSPTINGTYPLTGSCGNSNGAGTVNLSITSNGSTTQLGNFSLSTTGTFDAIVIIPSSASQGTATISASCSNGTSFNSPVTIASQAINNLTLTGDQNLGGIGMATGTCGTNAINAYGNVAFSLWKDGSNTPLIGSNTVTDTNGMFTANLNYPTSYDVGPTTLVITCPSGANFTTPIFLAAAQDTTGTVTLPSDNQAMGGNTDNTTPLGGVNAGQTSRSLAIQLGILVLLITAGGSIAYKAHKLKVQ